MTAVLVVRFACQFVLTKSRPPACPSVLWCTAAAQPTPNQHTSPATVAAAAAAVSSLCPYSSLSSTQLLRDALPSVPNISRLRIVNAGARGADASHLTDALLQLGGLRALQLHQVCVCVCM